MGKIKIESHDELLKLLERVEGGKVKGKRIFEKLLKDLESGSFSDERKIYTIIHILGEGRYYKAKKIIEKFLNHDSYSLRFIALNVLCLHWRLKEHSKTCIDFIKHEKDEDNRRLAVNCLGAIYFDTKNKKILGFLLKLFQNKKENDIFRESAYNSILDLLGVPYSQRSFIGHEFNPEKDVDYSMIDSLKKELKS